MVRQRAIKVVSYTIEVAGAPAHYRAAGEGEPVILVHGLSGSNLWWTRNVHSLAERYKVYMVDLPGFGSMRGERHRLVLSNAAAWLLQWMKAAGIERAHLIGHSMGGYICLRLAAQRPDVVRSLVLVAPAGMPIAHSVFGYLIPLLVAIRYMTPSFLFILFYDVLRAGPLTLLRATRDLLTKDIREDLESVKTPALIVWGENDTLVPPALGDILHRELEHSRLLILRGAGHIVMFDRAREFNQAVLRFLAE